MLDLVCKNCVKKVKDILIGYDLKELLYGLIPHAKNKIVSLNNKNNEEKKEEGGNDNEKIKEEKKEIIKFEEKEEDKINIIDEEENDINLSLLGKKKKSTFSIF